MRINCEKLVNWWWNEDVQKKYYLSFRHIINSFTDFLQSICNIFYTNYSRYFSLLNSLFTHFPHSSTTTTTIYINKEVI